MNSLSGISTDYYLINNFLLRMKVYKVFLKISANGVIPERQFLRICAHEHSHSETW